MYLPDLEIAYSASFSTVTASMGSQILAYEDLNRTGIHVQNNSPAIMVVAHSSCSFASHWALIPAYGFWEMPKPIYRGAIHTCHQTVTGSAHVTNFYRK